MKKYFAQFTFSSFSIDIR